MGYRIVVAFPGDQPDHPVSDIDSLGSATKFAMNLADNIRSDPAFDAMDVKPSWVCVYAADRLEMQIEVEAVGLDRKASASSATIDPAR